jgi:hypothetical protein
LDLDDAQLEVVDAESATHECVVVSMVHKLGMGADNPLVLRNVFRRELLCSVADNRP